MTGAAFESVGYEVRCINSCITHVIPQHMTRHRVSMHVPLVFLQGDGLGKSFDADKANNGSGGSGISSGVGIKRDRSSKSKQELNKLKRQGKGKQVRGGVTDFSCMALWMG